MIDPEVGKLARERIGPRMEERRRLLSRQIETINNTMAIRGLGSSSVRNKAIQEACEQETAARATLAWENLKAVLAATGVSFSEELAGDLKAEVAQHVHSGDLAQLVNAASGDDQRIRESVGRALRMIGSDIDLYAVNLKRTAEDQGRAGQPIYNFMGPVGAVQTGPYATATVVQQFGPAQREALSQALQALRARVEAIEAAAMPQKAELVELIDDARMEVKRDQPNRLRLTSALSGIAMTIQTVGAAPDAYAALKAAAAAVGITLP
ncbi:MAG: hypothetical protein ACREJ9_12595 [Candidatus Rokuibacteriota bacterium]